MNRIFHVPFSANLAEREKKKRNKNENIKSLLKKNQIRWDFFLEGVLDANQPVFLYIWADISNGFADSVGTR